MGMGSYQCILFSYECSGEYKPDALVNNVIRKILIKIIMIMIIIIIVITTHK